MWGVVQFGGPTFNLGEIFCCFIKLLTLPYILVTDS